MAHKLTSDSSVTYNAEAQTSGVLTITLTYINYEPDNNHNLSILGEVTSGNTSVASLNYSLSENAWNTFFNAQTLSSSEEYNKQVEAALLYVKQEINSKWGLNSSNWTYSNT